MEVEESSEDTVKNCEAVTMMDSQIAESIENAVEPSADSEMATDKGSEISISGSAKEEVVVEEKCEENQEKEKCELTKNLKNKKATVRRRKKKYYGKKIKRKRFKCNLCNRGLKTLVNLARHKELHKREKPSTKIDLDNYTTPQKKFKCEICLSMWASKSVLEKHKLKHTRYEQRRSKGSESAKRYECNICKERFYESQELEGHQATHTVQNAYLCGICHNKFEDLDKVKRHMQYHKETIAHAQKVKSAASSSSAMFKCKICLMQCKSLSELVEHKSQHIRPNPFSCKMCQDRFPCKADLKDHEKTHQTQPAVLVHLKTSDDKAVSQHSEVPPVKSSSIPKTPEPTILVEQQNQPEEPKFSCPLCPKSFSAREQLGEHFVKHCNTFTCKFCCMKFGTKFARRQHYKQMHSQELQLQCEECGETFNDGEEFDRHCTSVHETTVQPTCGVCSKLCSNSSALLKHAWMHADND